MKALTSFVCLNPILVLATTVVAADPDWKSIAEIMAMPEEQVIGLVSEQTPIECPDPAAEAYRRGLKKSWKWSPQEPDKITSPIDGRSLPNPEYP